MKNIIKIASAVAVALTVTQSLQATLITGNIGFSGAVVYNTASAGTASQVTSWITPIVTVDSGDFKTPSPFAVTPGTAATFSSSIWNFNTSTGLNPFWSVGGFTFQLLSSYIFNQGGTPGLTGFVVVDGTGIVSGNGFAPTVMDWSFTSQDPIAGSNPDSWTFSASSKSSVPDGGVTAILLGTALSGVALLRKRLMA